MNSIEQIQKKFVTFLTQRFDISAQQARPCQLTLNIDENKQNFGDLNSSAAMVLAKRINQPPREIAQTIVDEFAHPLIDKTEIAGPGFLNFFLTTAAVQQLAQQLLNQGEKFFTLPDNMPRYDYNIEFVSANPTGPLHLGHGRGGIIGDVLGNILKFLGHKVTKEFYINDGGAQMLKLGNSFKIRVQQELEQSVELPADGYQGQYLVELAQACIAQHGKTVLENNDEFFVQYAKEHLLEQLKQTLADYGIHFDVWFSEKTLHTSGAIQQALTYLQEHGLTYEKDAALWFKSTEYGDDKDRVLRKSSGALTYVAADIAYMKDKIDRGANQLAMTLGQDHHSYVVRLHGLQKAMDLDQIPFNIILYQLVSIKEGGQQLRMSKRAGRMVTLQEVINWVGTDVARFFYLNRKADAHLDFDLDLALKKTDENPVYYVQYAYVRTHSILEKAEKEEQLQYISADDAQHLGPEETFLLKKIISLKNLLEAINNNRQTHLLTYYVLELANAFHSYYAKNRVIELDNIPQSRARLLMITVLRSSFATSLRLLGISAPEKM